MSAGECDSSFTVVHAGAPVAVTGELNGNVLTVTSSANITSMLPGNPATSQDQLVAPNPDPLRVLIINTHFSGGQPAVSNAAITALLPRVSSQLQNCSYGQMRIDPGTRVVGPVDIGARVGPDCPPDDAMYTWMDTARQRV